MSPLYCQGKMYNGPEKLFTRCCLCGKTNYEKNEGDVCGESIQGYLVLKSNRITNNVKEVCDGIKLRNYENIIGIIDQVIDDMETLRRILDDEEFYKQ